MPRIRCIGAALAAFAALVVPTAGVAKPSGAGVDKLAVDACAQERKAMGRPAFKKKYGEKRPMRACLRRSRGKVQSAVDQATHACEQELALLGWAAFVDLYGIDPSGADAFAECVAEDIDATLDPTAEEVGDDEVDDE